MSVFWSSVILEVREHFLINVNHEMDVGLHGWVSTPPPGTAGHTKVREGFVFQLYFFFSDVNHENGCKPCMIGAPVMYQKVRGICISSQFFFFFFDLFSRGVWDEQSVRQCLLS